MDFSKLLGDVKKQAANGRGFCSALQFAFRFGDLASEKKLERGRTKEDSSKAGCESKESEIVKLQPAYVKERRSTAQYSCSPELRTSNCREACSPCV